MTRNFQVFLIQAKGHEPLGQKVKGDRIENDSIAPTKEANGILIVMGFHGKLLS